MAVPALALLLLILTAPALAQTVHAGAPLPAGGALPADADRAVVESLYAAAARGDTAAIAAALDDHVLWIGPDGRILGRVAVADRLAALAPPAGLATDAHGRVVVAEAPGCAPAVRTVWRLLDGRVVGVEQTHGAPPGDR